MNVDLTEIQHQPLPGRSLDGHRVVTTSLKTKMDRLQAELARLEAERDQADRLMTELLKATAEMMMAAKEAAAPRLDGALVVLNREDVTRLPPHQRNIAMVFQSSLLYPHLSSRLNIVMSLKRSGLSHADIAKRVEETAAMLDITSLLDKLPSELSGGERQRVATAKAIVRQPDAFLLDEPPAALDAALRLTLRSELVNLQKRLRTTMIFVTHDQTEAMTMGDRIAVMRGGRLEQIGTPDEIYNRPDTLFAAGFVGLPPMNLFPGVVVSVDGRIGIRCGATAAALNGDNPALAARGAGARVIVAVRPQHLYVQSEANTATLPATVFALEHLGKESVIILEAANQAKIRAIVEPGVSARVGSTLYIGFDMSKGLFFDPDTGRAIR